MGTCESRYDHKKTITQSQYYVGQNIFIKLDANDMLKKYKTIKSIGAGAYGEVQLVKHKLTQTERVMKQIKKSKDQDQDKMFFTEVQTYLLMDHPNIMRIYETYQDSKNYYIISEYLKGGDLLTRVLKMEKGNLTEKKISSYMQQVLLGISHCHACGIIHRDIKPGNIIFESEDDNSVLKIIDFGTSKIKTEKDDDEDDHQIVGTPLYVAPEVVGPDEIYDEKCDVWSTGMMLHQLLTGGFPFQEKQTPETIIDIIVHNRLNFAKLDGDKVISDDAKDLIKKMLQHNPSKRISIREALNHRWIKDPSKKVKIGAKTLENIKNFHVSSKLQLAIIYMISTEASSSKENEKWRKEFSAIDQNHDGKLEVEELAKAYTALNGNALKAESIAENIMKKADLDNNHKIDFSEFLIASQQITQSQSKQKLEKVFKLLDQNGDGQITINELKKVMVGVKNEQCQEFIQQFDRDRDGKVNYQEFINGFHKKIQEDKFRNSLLQTIQQHQ